MLVVDMLVHAVQQRCFNHLMLLLFLLLLSCCQNPAGGLVSAGKLSPARAMFAWSHQQQQQQQQSAAQQDQQQQQQRQLPGMVRTGAVVLSLQGPVEMELLIAQVCMLTV
jgi:hypothetical protein